MFSLQYPIKPMHNGIIMLTQGFGENRNDFYSQLGMKGHNGADAYVRHCQDGHAPVYAAHSGCVISDATQQSDTAGRFVKILSDEVEINGRKCKVSTVYFHLFTCRVSTHQDPNDFRYREMYYVKPGSHYIKAGQEIGTTDNTGKYTTGPHLHFGMYILWKQKDGSYKKDADNGYDGAVDPMPYFLDDMIYQLPMGLTTSWFWHNGKRIERNEIDTHMRPDLKAMADEWYTSYKAAVLFLDTLKHRFNK